jgi:phosphoribosylformylglycinamidine synthase
VGELEMDFLHNGMPRPVRKAIWPEPTFHSEQPDDSVNFKDMLHSILAAPNVCSKEWVIRQYDHEVQAGSVLKPLVGIHNDGPGDACITRPRLDSDRAIVLSNGLNPKYGFLDPYWMAASAIDEAVRNIIAVGGRLDRTALLDNFCWGNTEKPDRLGSLVRAATACYDIAKIYETPFISGKDSLNNEFQTETGESISIPPTLLISAISIMDDATKAVSMDLKKAGNFIYTLGVTRDEMGGSHYYDFLNIKSGDVPKVNAQSAKKLYKRLNESINLNLVRACHDCSEGGIAVALAEMAFAGGFGVKVGLNDIPFDGEYKRNDILLFSESNSRFLVEVEPASQTRFEHLFNNVPCQRIGTVTDDKNVRIYGLEKQLLIDERITELRKSWQKTLGW